MTAEARKTRLDDTTGCTEEITFFGSSPHMFGCTHLPRGEARAGVVVFSSTHAELLKAYHLEVLLGRALAERGFAVQRFHYRGDGNSEGNTADLTLSAMVEAGREARELLMERAGVTNLAFVGVRLGAYPATTLAAESDGAPLVFWDPVLDTDRFVKDALRSHAIAAIKGEAKPERTEQTLERLDTEGSIELLGYEITSAFHDSIKGKKLENYQPGKREVVVVPFGTLNTEPLAQAWGANGITVNDLDGTEREAWWLDEQATRDRRTRGRTLASRTADWLTENMFG